jgi:hypothetical protein
VLRFDVFGRRVDISGAPGSWQAWYPGSEGKRRPADFVVPHDTPEDGLLDYLADLFHEDASPRRPTARRLGS